MLRIARFAFAMAALLGAAATLAQATAYPNKPVKIIVTFTTGGAADFTARVIGDQLSRIWNQQVVVENKPGGATIIATEAVAKSKPDGYTLAQAPISVFRFPHMVKTNFDPIRDLTWIINTTGYTFGVTVRADGTLFITDSYNDRILKIVR